MLADIDIYRNNEKCDKYQEKSWKPVLLQMCNSFAFGKFKFQKENACVCPSIEPNYTPGK